VAPKDKHQQRGLQFLMVGARFLLGFTCISILLGVQPMAPDTVSAQGPYTRYVSTTGVDILGWVTPSEPVLNDCRDPEQPCFRINLAVHQASSGDTVQIAQGTYVRQPGIPRLISGYPIMINKSLTIQGAGTSLTVIDGDSLGPVLFAGNWPLSTVEVQVSGLTIQNGFSTEGGCISNSNLSSLTLNDTIVRSCVGSAGGGIINSGQLTLNNTTISGNLADVDGGGIMNTGHLILNSSAVTANAARHGGGIAMTSGLVTVSDSVITNNTANGDGGGIWNGGGGVGGPPGGTLTVANSSVAGNAAAGDGGGVWLSTWGGITSAVRDSEVTGNSAGGDGGGIFNDSTLTVAGSDVRGNTARHGGGLANHTGELVVTTSTISGNTAHSQGGGILNFYDGADATLTLVDSTVSDNVASTGGGVSNSGPGHVWVTNSTLSGNEALVSGGGLSNQGNLVVNNGTVSGNVAASQGGGVLSTPGRGRSWFSNSILAGNTLGGSEAEGPDCWGPLESQGYNLIQNTLDCAIGGDSTGNIIGLDPLLVPLQDNGGPTLTHAVLPGSPAVDAGNPSGCTDHLGNPLATDQRGVPRPQGPACDIGAYEFEGEVDTDSDGIPDAEDACPDDPEDVDGFEDEDGCPDPDNDADGVPDSSDACPDDAEDADGFEDSDGCPDLDNDGDGILDVADACPNAPEDVDGFQDADGCPDPDNDGDGILDVGDACPNAPEDADGFQDADGCPEPCPGGDVNGDGRVDMRDVALVAMALGSRPGQPRWNPAADLNHDGRVDLRDLVIVLRSSLDRTCRP